MTDGMTEKVLQSFDQALARGVPAIKIVRGVARTFDLRRERVLEILTEAGRIRTINSDGATVLWSTCPPPASARSVERQTREELLQAGVDYAIAHRLVDSKDIARTGPVRLFELVKTSLGSPDEDEREAA